MSRENDVEFERAYDLAVAGAYERNGSVWTANAGDDGAENVGQFGAHDQ